MPMPLNPADVQACKALQKQHGTSYFFATRLMPKRLRDATFVLYAFFRVPDEFVDNPEPNTNPEQKLSDWHKAWLVAYEQGTSEHPVLRAAAMIHHEYQIPIAPSETFLKAMQEDVAKSRYANYTELRHYMDGSAAAVGEIMAYTIGFTNPQALQHARDLGYAMQLTNFLRDVAEDYQARGRIYLPQDLLQKYGVKDADFQLNQCSPELKRVIQDLAERARQLYRSADQGIPMLAPDGQVPVRIASRLYEAILDKLAAQDWDPFVGRASTNPWEKLKILAKAL
jgi:15-cis-phytoene synthase